MTAALQNYHIRMQRVLDYIDRHLDGDLDLETVSRVAAFSKFHFHRQFTATFELSVYRHIQLARMKRASHRLALKHAQSVTDVALDAGYDAPDAFARAFRQRFGQSPSSFRKSPNWDSWLSASLIPEVPAHEVVVELFLPLKQRLRMAACPVRRKLTGTPGCLRYRGRNRAGRVHLCRFHLSCSKSARRSGRAHPGPGIRS
jgi:AraC-like DNA-binding protein